ncbi:MAG: hypothetical protein RI580_09120 [Halothece sp. Uz-M2-17]|nr:hypothetical protein [Halothece sp. Uz-M2-17]
MSSQPEKIKPKINIKNASNPSENPRTPAKTQQQAPQTEQTMGSKNQFPPQPFLKPQSQSKMSKSAPLIERELRQILPQLRPEQRQQIAHQLITQLQEKGIEEQRLKQNLSLSTMNPETMNPQQISQVATYAYQHDPEVFEAVLTQPNVVQFLSSPVLSAIVGIMAAKWLNH